MQNEPIKIEIKVTPEFKRSLRTLAKHYRFIYYLKTSNQMILVALYSKSDQGDVSADTINRIVANFESE